MNLPGYDDWLTTPPDMPSVGQGERGLAYTCLDCAWQGRGGTKAFDHHRESRHHRIQLCNGLIVQFGCCHEVARDE